MNKRPLISILIVNWNGLSQLKTCLPSLKKQKYKNIEVIIVDNASKDGSVAYIRRYFPMIEIVHNDKNYGFAEGCNRGLPFVKGEYVLLLNNDTEITPYFLNILVRDIERNPKVAVVQPKIIYRESKELQSGATFLSHTGFLYYYGYAKNPNDAKYNKEMEIFSANGSCMLIRTDVIEKIGLFDPDYFAYFEETDFCWRVWLAGYKILYVPEATIYHEGAQTSRLLASDFVSYHSFKNRINSLIKNLELRNLVIILPLHLLLCEAFSLLNLFKMKTKSFIAIQKAIFWNITIFTQTLAKREEINKKLRKKTDASLFTKILKDPSLSYYYYLTNNLSNYLDRE